MHQSPKAPEQRTLRRVRERASAVRVAGATAKTVPVVTCRNNDNDADNAEDSGVQTELTTRAADVAPLTRETEVDKPSAVSQSIDTVLFGGGLQVDIPTLTSTKVSADDLGLTFRVACSNPNQLDPASPSLADRACVLGQALKSREFEVDSWSLLRPADPISDSLDRPDTESRGGHPGLASGPSFIVCSSSSDRLRLADFEDDSLKRKPMKFRRRRSRSKPFGRIFQPSLSKLSEEGSPASSSPASSSTVSIDANEPADVLHPSPYSVQPHPLNRRFSDELCLSVNSLIDGNNGRLSHVLEQQQQLVVGVDPKQQASVTSNCKSASLRFEDEPVGNETLHSTVLPILETKTCSTTLLSDYTMDEVSGIYFRLFRSNLSPKKVVLLFTCFPM
ncbi:hypothetical protein PHET_10939 [Paragonimus heterotremus]|uniref:Uncharacterized protein n=1 Tax=Paragonimus heterotremus TaxID=100268 RepID=A0A8J4SQN7_9TREM|nr:hypothetical protein PHET_10939 [Paragonimus heterotremus]